MSVPIVVSPLPADSLAPAFPLTTDISVFGESLVLDLGVEVFSQEVAARVTLVDYVVDGTALGVGATRVWLDALQTSADNINWQTTPARCVQSANIFPSTEILDDYNRGDGAPGANYTQPVWNISGGGSFAISGNALLTGGNSSGVAYSAEQFGPDVEIYATLAVVGQVELRARYVGLANASSAGYALQLGTLGFVICRDPSLVALGEGVYITPALTSGDMIGMRVIGNRIEGWVKRVGGIWEMKIARLDTAHAERGYIGLRAQDAVAKFDDLGGGTIPPGNQIFAVGDSISLVAPSQRYLKIPLFIASAPGVVFAELNKRPVARVLIDIEGE